MQRYLTQQEIREMLVVAEYYDDYDKVLEENHVKMSKNEIKLIKKEQKIHENNKIDKSCVICGKTKLDGLLFKIKGEYRCKQHLENI